MDPYKILNITKKSSPKEIRDSYLKLAKLHHPDKNNGSTAKKFQEIEFAYTLLTGNIRRHDPEPEPKSKSKPKTEPKSKPEPKPEPKPKTEPKPEPKPKSEPKPKPKPEPKFRKNQSLDSFLKEQVNDFYMEFLHV
jgi:outer membrane biosynthesis protein TonB